jgi:hypothetical protein
MQYTAYADVHPQPRTADSTATDGLQAAHVHVHVLSSTVELGVQMPIDRTTP